MFKQMKDMKKTVAAAPGLVDQAMQLQEQAQHMQAAQQAAMMQTPAAAPTAATAVVTGPDAEPIAGVSLEQYAIICRAMVGANDPSVAASHGISPEAWQAAQDGWTARMQKSHAVAQRFNALYTGR